MATDKERQALLRWYMDADFEREECCRRLLLVLSGVVTFDAIARMRALEEQNAK